MGEFVGKLIELEGAVMFNEDGDLLFTWLYLIKFMTHGDWVVVV